MPKIHDDSRDPVKFAIGEKIRWMQDNDPDQLAEYLSLLTEEEANEILYDDEIMLREKQWVDLSAKEDLTILCAGRGFGKTRTIASTVKRAVEKHGLTQIMIIAPTARTLSRTIAPAIIDLYPPGHENTPRLRQGWMQWPNGAEAILIPAEAGADAPRSANSELLILEEAAFYGNQEDIITQAELTCRIPPAKTVVATTPKNTPQLVEWMRRIKEGDPNIRLINGSTIENRHNLSDKFVKVVFEKYKGTRLEEIELEGKLILENEDALFQRHDIARYEIEHRAVPKMVKYSIGVDPAILSKNSKNSAGKKNQRKPDSVGIVVSGLGDDGLVYTLEDHTKRYGSGAKWMERVSMLYDQLSHVAKTTITVEVNAIGLEFIQSGFNEIGRSDIGRKLSPTFSTESKIARLQPYALIHDQGKVRWMSEGGHLEDLFTELTTYTAETKKSPDHADAWVFSLMDLNPTKQSFVKSYEMLV